MQHQSYRTLIISALLCLAGFALCQQAVAQSYSITNLGTLGGNSSFAYGVNNAGQVTGWALSADGNYHGFLWQNGVMTGFGPLGGYFFNYSAALSINNVGQVVGGAFTVADNYHAFLWQNGVMTDLGTLGGHWSNALGINDAGQVVGLAQNAVTIDDRAFLWQNGVMTSLGTLGGAWSIAYAINNAGQVVGESSTPRSNITDNYHAFLWQNGIMTDLGSQGTESESFAVNNAGQVVGEVHNSGGGNYHAFLWQNGIMTDLGTPPGFSYSDAFAVNNAGQVVGDAYNLDSSGNFTNELAFLWRNGNLFDLNNLIPANSGWVLENARAINDAGQIVGTGTFHGLVRAFLLTPTSGSPGPTPIVLTNLNVSNIGLTSATITWNTNVPANSVVEYGTPAAYDHSVSDSALVTSHTITLNGLSPFHIYHYRVSSTAVGQTAVSADTTFVASNMPVFYETFANLRKNASGNYLIDITFHNQGSITIPSVHLSYATLGNVAPTSPTLTLNLPSIAPGASRTVTLTFPHTAGASGARAVLLGGGWTDTTFGDPGFLFFNFSDRITLP